MTSVAERERADLLDLLEDLGPHAATLCTGWDTHDLAAHLVARERRPLALPGLVLPHLHPVTEVFERRARTKDYDALLAVLRAGPPPWSPVALPAANLHEFYVHSEDVRRCAGSGPRRLPRDTQDALWARLQVLGPVLARRGHGLGISLVTPGARTARIRVGRRPVVLRGEVGELFLWLFGRRTAADVEVEGSPEAVARAEAIDLRW